MAEACELLDAPVVSGNVSFYNETPATPSTPPPWSACSASSTTCAVHVDHRFKDADDVVVLLGTLETAAIDGSEYQKRIFDAVAGRVPDVDLAGEAALQRVVRPASRRVS